MASSAPPRAVVRHLYQGRVVVAGILLNPQPEMHSPRDIISPRVKIRITEVTNKGWPYPPKIGDEMWVSLHPKGARR